MFLDFAPDGRRHPRSDAVWRNEPAAPRGYAVGYAAADHLLRRAGEQRASIGPASGRSGRFCSAAIWAATNSSSFIWWTRRTATSCGLPTASRATRCGVFARRQVGRVDERGGGFRALSHHGGRRVRSRRRRARCSKKTEAGRRARSLRTIRRWPSYARYSDQRTADVARRSDERTQGADQAVAGEDLSRVAAVLGRTGGASFTSRTRIPSFAASCATICAPTTRMR